MISPAELPPERNVFYTIPLKSDESPPKRKTYGMSRDEMQEGERQITMLLQKGCRKAIVNKTVLSSMLQRRMGLRACRLPCTKQADQKENIPIAMR